MPTPIQEHSLVIDRPLLEEQLVTGLATVLVETPALDSGSGQQPAKQPAAPRGTRKKTVARARAKPRARPVKQEIPDATLEKLIKIVRAAIKKSAVAAQSAPAPDPGVLKLAKVIDRSLPKVRKQHSDAAIEKLVDALLDTHDPVAPLYREIDAANARARLRFMDEIPSLTSEEVASAAGHSARNRSQTASRWKSEGRIFSVRWQGQERFPAFQFKEGAPLPAVSEALSALPERMSPWERAFWFVSTNSWLGNAAPSDHLSEPNKVADAARKEAEAVIG